MFGEITDGCAFNPIWNLDFFRVSFENILEVSMYFVLYGRFIQLIWKQGKNQGTLSAKPWAYKQIQKQKKESYYLTSNP